MFNFYTENFDFPFENIFTQILSSQPVKTNEGIKTLSDT